VVVQETIVNAGGRRSTSLPPAFHADFLLGFFFDPEGGGDMFL
jgi:hypothetical protein